MLTFNSFVFICAYILSVSYGLPVGGSLDQFLLSTTHFFDQLALNYDSELPSPELYKAIDNEVNEYVKEVKKSTNLSRVKRHLELDKHIGILNGFDNISDLHLPDAIDATFFVQSVGSSSGSQGGRSGEQYRWYAAALNSSGMYLFQYQRQRFKHVGTYELENGIYIISHSCDSGTLLVVQRTIGDALVIRLSLENDVETLQKVQTIDTSDATHAALWRGMEQIYLGVASPKNLTIFTWLGEHFDRIQTTNFGATRLVPLQIRNSMHLVVIDRARTLILKFFLATKKFVVVQRLSGANDATAFYIEKRHRDEHFLALAGNKSTTIYKHSRHRFVPFQEISSASEIRSLTNDAAILLFLTKHARLTILQYDGWKFVDTGIRDDDISSVRSVNFQGNEFLAVRLKDTKNVSRQSFDGAYYDNSTDKLLQGTNESEDDSTIMPVETSGRAMETGEFSVTINSWSFRQIIWRQKKTWSNLREETKVWCQDSLEKTRRSPPTVPQLKTPLVIQRGRIQTLRVLNVNGQSAEKFVNLTKRWNAILSETSEQKKALRSYMSTVNPSFKNLRAGNVRVKCTSTCRAERTNASIGIESLERLRTIDDVHQNLNFDNVKVAFAKNLPCPIPAPKFRDATVSGLVNGLSFPEFTENVMKVTGDQEFTDSLTFSELRVVNAKIPLDVTSNFSRQDISVKSVEVEDLNITSGGLLLPLNGDGITAMTGSITVSKATMNGLVHMRGKIRGSGADVLSPLVHITEPLEISGNVSLRNVKIVDSLRAKDFTRSEGKSLGEIISKAVPLDAEQIPVRLKFQQDNVSWSNMTLRKFPWRWVTTKNSGRVVITGNKYATGSDITLGELAFKNLPIPRLPLSLCRVSAISDGIWESNLEIDQGNAESVKSINVVENSEFGEFYADLANSLDEVRWELKNLTGRIKVEEAKIGEVTDMDYHGLKNSMARWAAPDRLKGPLILHNLQANHLIPKGGLKLPLPLVVGNVESKKNLYVGTVNNVDFQKFVTDTVKIGDSISLTNVTFAGGLVAKEISASKTSFTLQETLSTGYLGSKEISGRFQSKELIVPDVFKMPSSDTPVKIVVNGNVKFTKEPKIKNVNNRNLEELYNEVWLSNRPATISAEYIEFKNVTFVNNLNVSKSFETPNLGPWAGLENRLLSKTRSQVINTTVSFDSIIAPNVIGSAKTKLLSNVTYLRDLEVNSLKINETQVINDKWHFEELIIIGDFDLHGRINGLNFTTDVVRHDVEHNVITGKKTFDDLTTRNIDGLEFDKLANNALRKHNGNRTIVIKGQKTFKTVEMPNVSVDGTIMGQRMENLLLKTGGQNLSSTKVFQGSVSSPAILPTGFVNDIDLKYFVNYQLKKRDPSQIIKTPILFLNDVKILGNMTIDGLYQGVELKNFKTTDDIMGPVVEEMSNLMSFAEGIEMALDNRATYWDSLELLETNSTPLISDPERNESLTFDELGRCGITETSLYCHDREVFHPLPFGSNGSRVLQAEVIDLSGSSLVASIVSDPAGGIFIFQYNVDEKRFDKMADLRVPEIMEGSLTTSMDSLWISLRLRDHIMIIRYAKWAGFEEWTLPGNGPFLMSSTPTDELLIFRSDGVWRLGGLAGPRHIFRATLNGQIDTFSFGPDYYVQLTDNNVTTLLKTKYIGN